MSLFSLGLLAAYFAGGVQFMMNQEGWDAADAFYFWSRAVHKSNCCGASAHAIDANAPDSLLEFHTGA